MNRPTIFRLDRVSVVDVRGADAAVIVNNLTTHEVKSLSAGEGRECFVTDVRGKTIGHVCLFRSADAIRMVGAPGQSEAIVTHIDRYTIREDASPEVQDQDHVAYVLPPEVASQLELKLVEGVALAGKTRTFGDLEVMAYGTRWLGPGTAVLLTSQEDSQPLAEALKGVLSAFDEPTGMLVETEEAFHRARTIAGFPWYGVDLDDSNLPQEADRDEEAISFTKGCYLGQETVARLDALGKVQRKLVVWSIDGGVPPAGTTLVAVEKTVAGEKTVSGEKKVGRLTSVAENGSGGAIAIGFARRSHFDSGSTATGRIESTGTEITGTVL